MAELTARGQRLLLVLAALSLGLAGCAGAGAGTAGATPGSRSGQAALQTATVSASPVAAAPSDTAALQATATFEATAAPSVTAAPSETATPTTVATQQPSATPPATATQRPPATPTPPARPSATPSAGPGGSKEAFIRELAPLAQAEQADSGVPAAFSIALAASETGWGVSPLMKTANSYLGLTCSTPNEGLPCVRYGGGLWNAYSSPLNAFLWHGRWLRAHSQFAAAFPHTGDVAAFTHEIWHCYISCGAPFPNNQYNGTMALIAEYNLEQYDVKP